MPLFTLPFDEEDPLFCVTFHPEQPQFAVGLATGRVTCYSYDPKAETVEVAIIWTTKRHKGSCRAIGYTQNGISLVTCGMDGVVKKCSSVTGKVTTKTTLKGGPTAMAINEEYIAIGDESGKLTVLNLELKVHRTYQLDGAENVSCVCSLSGQNKHNFAVAADMFVFRIDARKDEPISRSEDQEDDILCGCVASNSRSAWGLSVGVLTVWNNRGLGDQQHRIKLTTDGNVDCVLAGEHDDTAIAGTSDGQVVECDLAGGQVTRRAQHGDDEVSYLDYDCEYRLVTGSMSLLKVWSKNEFEEMDAVLRAEKKASKKRKAVKATKTAKEVKKSKFADLMG